MKSVELYFDYASPWAYLASSLAPRVLAATLPLNGLYAARGALFTLEHGGFAAYHEAIFHAGWRASRDLSRREEVVAIAVESGQDPVAFAAGLEAPAIKERLKADTARAEERGVFGVPSFLVGDELYWGHDRLEYVARALDAAR